MKVFIVKRGREDGRLETLTRYGVLACFTEEDLAQEMADKIGGFVAEHEAEASQVGEYLFMGDEEIKEVQA